MSLLERPCECRSTSPIARYFRRPPVRLMPRSPKRRMSNEDQAGCISSTAPTTFRCFLCRPSNSGGISRFRLLGRRTRRHGAACALGSRSLRNVQHELKGVKCPRGLIPYRKRVEYPDPLSVFAPELLDRLVIFSLVSKGTSRSPSTLIWVRRRAEGLACTELGTLSAPLGRHQTHSFSATVHHSHGSTSAAAT